MRWSTVLALDKTCYEKDRERLLRNHDLEFFFLSFFLQKENKYIIFSPSLYGCPTNSFQILYSTVQNLILTQFQMRTEALNLELSRWARMNHSQTDRVHQFIPNPPSTNCSGNRGRKLLYPRSRQSLVIINIIVYN